MSKTHVWYLKIDLFTQLIICAIKRMKTSAQMNYNMFLLGPFPTRYYLLCLPAEFKCKIMNFSQETSPAWLFYILHHK